MKRIFVLLAGVAVLATACASSSAGSPAAPKGKACADLMVKAIRSADPVPGSYACLNADSQSGLDYIGVSPDDAGLSVAISDPDVTAATYLGATGDGGFIYVLTKPQGSHIQIVWTDDQGKVTALEFTQHP